MPEGHTWTEVAALAGAALLVVPVGSYEQHGPHLPLDTDTRIAVALAASLARPGIVVAPPIAIGASGEHAGFPGTLSIGHEVLAAVLVEIVRSARGAFRGVVFVSGHGGNAGALARAIRISRAEGDSVLCWAPRVVGGDAHAGRTETALLLAIHPAAVRTAALEPGCPDELTTLIDRLRTDGVRAVSDNGVLGDPRQATAAEGERLLAALRHELVTATNHFSAGLPVAPQSEPTVRVGGVAR
jgi:mycofactocin system creatininase family protein